MIHRPGLLLVFIIACLGARVSAAMPHDLWVYAPVNFQHEPSVVHLLELMQRAGAAGYSRVLITDFKFGRLEDRPAHYYTNLKRVREAADRLGLKLIASVADIGYSGALLLNDPNLAEGLPAREVPYIVHGDKAQVEAPELLDDGSLDTPDRNKPRGWTWVDGFGQSTSIDTQIKRSGSGSLKMTDFRKGNPDGNCRLVKTLTLRPFTPYHLRFWVKSQDVKYDSELKVAVLPKDGQRSLNYTNLGVKSTQDWTEHHIVFNTFEYETVNVYIGLWGGRSGTMWVDDVSLKSAGAVNMIRREGAPIRIASTDGSVVYEEGRDFERWIDPDAGTKPWFGAFGIWHEPPAITLTPNSRIADGQKLAASFDHVVLVYDEQVASCLMHPGVFDAVQRQVAGLARMLKPDGWLMAHDELRVAGWCELCKGRPTGQVLADNVRRCSQIIRGIDPSSPIYVWSDMFDPHHNARDNYYLVSGDLAGSWEGLSPEVNIGNWNAGHAVDSLKFFAGRGHGQFIAGYYDHADVEAGVRKWLDAASGVQGVAGVMYTTWRNDYSNLERFAKAVRAIEAPTAP